MCSDNLDAAQVAAIAKAINTKELASARAAFDAEGEDFSIDMTVRLFGSLSVGAEVETTQINKIQPLKLLLVALNKLNGATLHSIIDQALAIDDKDVAFVALKKSVSDEWSKVAGSTRQMRAGAIKFNGTVEEV